MKKEKGFTLVELLIVITIIAVLSAIGMTVYSNAQKSARDAKRRGDLKAVAAALEQYKTTNGTYTPATSFPCTSDWVHSLADASWGTSGSTTGCPASVKNAWANYFSGSMPTDPSSGSGWNNYSLSISGGTSFTVYANLEVSPSPALSCATSSFNYCLQNQQ